MVKATRRRTGLATGGLLLAVGALGGALAGVLAGAGGAGGARTPTPARARAAAHPPAPRPGATVTVTGAGSVPVTPDTLTVQIGATTNAASAVAALDTNSADVVRLEAVLRAAGITSGEMQTSNLQLNANTNQHGVVTGYQASNELTVTTHRLEGAGAVIDAAAHGVGNDVQIQGISFSRSNLSPFERAARAAAVRQAATEAAALAGAAGARLGGIEKIVDEGSPVTPVGTASAAPVRGAVPIQPGMTSVSAQLKVVYALVG